MVKPERFREKDGRAQACCREQLPADPVTRDTEFEDTALPLPSLAAVEKMGED
jgi:hypothetical protein